MLLNPQHDLWLTDWMQVKQNQPLIIDYVLFERSLRLQWASELSLANWCDFETETTADDAEERLLNQAWLDKRQSLLVTLQEIACQACGCQPDTYRYVLFWSLVDFLANLRVDQVMTAAQTRCNLHTLVSIALMFDDSDRVQSELATSMQLDLSSNTVTIDGRIIQLTTTEFNLFQYLYDRANRVCSRLEIARDVFDADMGELSADPAGAAQRSVLDKQLHEKRKQDRESLEGARVNTAINRLRQKIEPNHKEPQYLVTIRGRGYRLNVPIT